MASSIEFVKYVCDQISQAGEITYKKMFGEYGIYCDDKFFACVCDDQFLIKITEAGKVYMPDYEIALPYEGAKPYFLISELEDQDFLKGLIEKTCQELPVRKKKEKKARVL